MLTQALAYERSDVPSLTGFLQWMETDDLEIKRQVDSSSNQIRVMTVHGAKGLEAPIVILPDTGRRNNDIKDDIIKLGEVPIWKPAAADMPDVLGDRIEEMKSAQLRERMRLLYVAMTRAEKWLIVAASGDLSKEGKDWYQTMEQALGHVNGVPIGDDGVIRFEEGDWGGLMPSESVVSAKFPLLESVFSTPAPPLSISSKTLSPSDLGGAKALGGEAGLDLEAALSYGSLVHLLLEELAGSPSKERQHIVNRFTQNWDSDLLDVAVAEVYAVLDTDHLTHLFAPSTLAEVPITAHIGPSRFHGIIDRLVITETEVLAVDYKTNRIVPDTPETCPEGLLRQMGAYAEMLGQLYPNHQINTAILWTTTQNLMVLPHNIVTDALWSSQILTGRGHIPRF